MSDIKWIGKCKAYNLLIIKIFKYSYNSNNKVLEIKKKYKKTCYYI